MKSLRVSNIRVLTVALIMCVMYYMPAGMADEYYVALDGTGGGTSWAAAFTNLQSALDVAGDGDTIYIAGNTFMLPDQIEWTTSGITVRGGYEGVGTPGNNDPALWPTVLARCSDSYTNRVMIIEGADDSTLENVTLTGGEVTNIVTGAGLCITDSQNVLLSGCIVENNHFDVSMSPVMRGAGIYASSSDVTLINCIVRQNSGRNNTSGNPAHIRGGGIWSDGTLTIRDSQITDNRILFWNRRAIRALGGGIYFDGSVLELNNVLVAGNHNHLGSGGGIYVNSGTADIKNSTIADNSTDGICQAGGTVTVTDSIVCGNWNDIEGDVTISYSNIGDTDYGDNNISADPLFEYGYYLANASPCIGTGSDTAGNLDLADYTTRTDGAPYSDPGDTVNMGWHYLPGTVFDMTYANIYVAEDGSDAYTGTSPGQPFRTVTKALSMVRDGTHVHIADGTYTPGTGETFPLTLANMTDIQILGSGNTIFDADGTETNVMNLFYLHRSVLEGITVTGGESRYGSGMQINFCQNFLMAACTIEHNSFYAGQAEAGTSYGGGIYTEGSSLTLANCLVSRNSTYVISSATSTNPRGGGLWSNGILIIRDSRIVDNHARGNRNPARGGGICFSGHLLEMKNVLVAGNYVHGGLGAGLFLHDIRDAWEMSVIIKNCTVADNGGHGIFRDDEGTLIVNNSIFRGNWDDIAGDDIETYVEVSYSNIGDTDYGESNISADPLFERGYYLADGSPCIGAGSDTASNLGMSDYARNMAGDTYGPEDTVNMGWHYKTGLDITYTNLYVAESGSDANDGTAPDKAFRTVTKALATAEEGTHIHVAEGTYTTGTGETFPLTIEDKSHIQVIGASASNTIFDAYASESSVMHMAHALGTGLRDITLQHGDFEGNGGGLFIDYSQGVLLSGCHILNNRAHDSVQATVSGGGIHAIHSTITVADCQIKGNLSRNTRSHSSGRTGGAGIAISGALKLHNSFILNNTNHSTSATTTTRGAVYSISPQSGRRNYGVLEIINTLIAGNIADPEVCGGVYAIKTKTDLINITVTDNTGAGVWREEEAPNILNSIIWGNDLDIDDDSESVTASYSNIGTGDYVDGGNNISSDPLFADPDANDYRILVKSPSVFTGLVQDWMTNTVALAGNPRLSRDADGIYKVDMGCYQTPPPPPSGTVLFLK